MRILREPDEEHIPRDENEVKVCSELKKLTGKDVSVLETREEYVTTHFDIDENPIDSGFDYIVSMSLKWQGWYVSGTEYGVNLTVDGQIETVELGSWVK